MQYLTKYKIADYILRLFKTLYDLKQLLHIWYICLHEHFEVIKFTVSLYNSSVFINKESTVNIIITVYIDNLLICGNSINLINHILKHLQSKFKMTDLKEVVNYLDMEIDITADFITICQYEYIQSVLKHFCINKCKPAVVPMLLSIKLVAY